MRNLVAKLRELVRSEEGATAIEYGVMVALIAAGIMVAVGAFRDNLNGLFDRVGAALSEAPQ